MTAFSIDAPARRATAKPRDAAFYQDPYAFYGELHRGTPTFAAMALTIAVITAVYCLTLCAYANAVAAQVRAHHGLARGLERLAGVFLIGVGLRLVKD